MQGTFILGVLGLRHAMREPRKAASINREYVCFVLLQILKAGSNPCQTMALYPVQHGVRFNHGSNKESKGALVANTNTQSRRQRLGLQLPASPLSIEAFQRHLSCSLSGICFPPAWVRLETGGSLGTTAQQLNMSTILASLICYEVHVAVLVRNNAERLLHG